MNKRDLQAAFRAKGQARGPNLNQSRLVLPDRIQYARKAAFGAWLAHWYEKLMTSEDYARVKTDAAYLREVLARDKLALEICVNDDKKPPFLSLDGVTVARFIYDYKFNEADAESFEDVRVSIPVQEKKP